MVRACVSPSDRITITAKSAGFISLALFRLEVFSEVHFLPCYKKALITDKGQMAQTFTNKCHGTVPALKRASSALGPDKLMVSDLPLCSLLPLVCSQECQTLGMGAGGVIAAASALHHALIFSSKGHPWVRFWSDMALNRPAKLQGKL